MNEVAAWAGTIDLHEAGALFMGQGGHACPHLLPAHKVIIGQAALATGRSRVVVDRVTVVPAATLHSVRAEGPLVLVYLDARYFDLASAHTLETRWRRERLGTASNLREVVLDTLMRTPRRAIDDRAVQSLDAFANGVAWDDASASVGLSGSRLTHLVSNSLMAPPRAWRTWLRLRRAIERVGQGESVTSAAHQAGFADASHLWRRCRATIGIAPSVLARSEIRVTTVSTSLPKQGAALPGVNSTA
jgi:AraC-like DNA-binding protein